MVSCPICHKRFKAITNRHLENRHGLTFAEFKKAFPGARTWSTETRAKIEGNKFALGHRHSETFKRRLRKAVSKPRPPWVREKIRKAHKRRMKDPEVRLKLFRATQESIRVRRQRAGRS